MGNEMKTAYGAAGVVVNSGLAVVTLGQHEGVNNEIKRCARLTGNSFMKSNVRHIGETAGVSIAAAATLGQCEAVNERVRVCAPRCGRVLAKTTEEVVDVTQATVGTATSLTLSGVALTVNAVQTVTTATFYGACRLVEVQFNGTFNQSKPDGITRMCAFASNDVYQVRRHGRPRGPGTINTRDGPWSVECVGGQKGSLTALYKVNRDTLILAFCGTAEGGDLGRCLLIAFGSLNSCSKVNNGYVQEMMHKHRCRHFFVTGHSQGGSMAQVFASDGNNYNLISGCHVFNPGSGLIQNDLNTGTINGMIRALGYRIPYILSFGQKITAHHIIGDVISFLTTSSSTTTVHTYDIVWGRDPHTMYNFTTPEMVRKSEEKHDLR